MINVQGDISSLYLLLYVEYPNESWHEYVETTDNDVCCVYVASVGFLGYFFFTQTHFDRNYEVTEHKEPVGQVKTRVRNKQKSLDDVSINIYIVFIALVASVCVSITQLIENHKCDIVHNHQNTNDGQGKILFSVFLPHYSQEYTEPEDQGQRLENVGGDVNIPSNFNIFSSCGRHIFIYH